MNTYQFLKALLLINIIACLIGCSIPKKFKLTDIDGFNQTQCAKLNADAFISLADFNRGSINFFGIDEKPLERGWRIYKDTKLEVNKIESTWDFENGYRIILNGKIPVNSETIKFFSQEYFLNQPDEKEYLHKIFSPCG